MMTRRLAFVFLLLVPVFAVQFVKINRPFAGHFASYQLVMASMARNTLKENFTQLLLPKTDLLVNGQRSLHLNQYPFPSVLAALGAKLFGGSLEFWGRFQSILFNAASLFLIGALAAFSGGERRRWLAMILYAFSPYTILYGQGFFSEPSSLFFLLLSLYALLDPVRHRATGFSALCFSIAVTGRIHFILLMPFMLLTIVFRHPPKKLLRIVYFSALALFLPLVWYGYTYWAALKSDHVLTNIFLQTGMRHWGDSNYLLNSRYYVTILKVFGAMMLTPLALPFLGIGLWLCRKNKEGLLILAGISTGLGIALLSPQKIMAHDFYLYEIFPFVCLATAAGLDSFLQRFPRLEKKSFAAVLLAVYFLSSVRFFYNPIFTHHENSNNLTGVAAAIQQKTDPDDKMIAAGEEPAGLVYYSDRPAWALSLKSVGRPLAGYLTNPRYTRVNLEEIQKEEAAMKDPVLWLEYLHQKGASYFAIANKEEIQGSPLEAHLESRYTRLSGPQDPYALYKLTP